MSDQDWIKSEELKYDTIWSKRAGSYSASSPEVIAFNGRIDPEFMPHGKILIVGAGNGTGYRWMKERGHEDIRTCDISGEVAKCYPEGVFTRCVAHELPYLDREFDSVYCIDVIEHMPEEAVPKALREIQRVTKVMGHIVVQARCAASVFEPDLHLCVHNGPWWDGMFRVSMNLCKLKTVTIGPDLMAMAVRVA